MAINPEEITTVRVDQLANVGLTLESLFPHTVGTELTSSSIQDLATLVATTIETLNGFGFLPVSVTDGQTLPAIPTNPSFILVGAGTYTNLNGFPDIICTENLNALMTLTDHWEIAVEIPINPLTGSVQSVTGSAVDNTDPLNPVVNLDSAVTSVNGLTGAVVLDGTNIDVTDPTTSTDATLNNALQNILDNSGGATPDLQAVTDVGGTITDGFDTNTVSASGVSINRIGTAEALEMYANIINIYDASNSLEIVPDSISISTGLGSVSLKPDLIVNNGTDYPLPTGVSSQIATLADITASTPDLQAVTDVGNTITDGTNTNNVSANAVSINDGVDFVELQKTQVQLTDYSRTATLTKDGLVINEGTNETQITKDQFVVTDGVDTTSLYLGKITSNGIDYPLPTGVSSQIATLADITGGVSDGDKGDITVSGGGTVWSIDNGVVSDAKVASGIDATKIADGSVNNTEFQYINSLTSNAQTQLNNRVITLLNDNVTTSAVTGTTANTIIKSYLIPANTLAIGDTLDFKTVVSKTGTNGTATFRVYTNTSNSLTGANSLGLMSFAASTLYYSLDRTYTLKNDNTLQCYNVATPNVTDESNVTGAISNVAFDRTVDNYLIIAVQPANGSDSFVQTLCYLMQMKAKTSI